MEVRFSKSVINFKNEHGEYNLRWYGSATQQWLKTRRIVRIIAFLLLILVVDMIFLSHYCRANPQQFWKEGKEITYQGKEFVVIKEEKTFFVLAPKGATPWIGAFSIEEKLGEAQKTFPNARTPKREEAHKIQVYCAPRVNVWYADNNGNHIAHIKTNGSGKANFYYVIEVMK